MENLNIEEQELFPPKIRSRRNSIQPIDRHINEIDFDGSIYINAGIDSTWFVLFLCFKRIFFNNFSGRKANIKVQLSTDQNQNSSNVFNSTSIQKEKSL
jgi:hypothetical protein